MSDTAVRAPWRLLQIVGLASTVALVIGLLWRPELSLRLLWNVVIPLVPASFLLSPLLWRNVCPLATLNMAGNGWVRQRRASATWVSRTNGVGIVLFGLLVPARRFLFNVDGPALAVTILAVGLGALLLGAVFDARAGFCNALCPVLPVERLYGQRPLLDVKRARCSTCSACGRACLDLSPERSVLKVARGRSGTGGWLLSPLGAFAAALPGFVMGYFTLVDQPLSAASSVYGWIAAFSASSYLLAGVVVLLLRPDFAQAIRVLGGFAVAIYYWFAAPGMADALGAPSLVGQVLRVAALALVAVWIRSAVSHPVSLPVRERA